MNKIGNLIEKRKTLIFIIVVVFFIVYLLIDSYQDGNKYYYLKGINDTSFRITGYNVIDYYLDYLKYRYEDYPWIVEISDLITTFSITFTLFVIVLIAINIYSSKRFAKYYNHLLINYSDKLKEVCTSQEGYTTNEIRKILNYTSTRKLKKWEIKAWMKLFMTVRLDIKNNYSSMNMYEAIDAIDMRSYIAQTFDDMSWGKQKEMLQFLIVLKIFVPHSQLLRLKSSNKLGLRRLAYIYCMMANVDDPYTEFLYNERSEDFSIWGRMELHVFFSFLKAEERKMPSFRTILQNNKNISVAPFFIEEAAYWGDDDDINHVLSYFQSPLFNCRMAAFNSVAIRKYVKAEPLLVKIYESQPGVLRRHILLSLLAINSGEMTDFFVNSYKEAASEQTKRAALHCLVKYNEDSYAIFKELKLEAMSDELFNFEHAENKLINNHFLLLAN
ncbi:MAG: hypothetical protein ACRC3Z_00090 [Phocaeicola sp.]